MTKTLIFDFDGTLADTFNMALEAYRHLAPVYGWKILTEEAIADIRGSRPKDLMRLFGVGKLQIPFLVAGVRAYVKRHAAEMQPCAQIGEALAALTAEGVTLGIVTSNSKENVETFLRAHNLEKHFLFVVSSRHLFGKHRTLKKIMVQNALNPLEVVYIGDEIRDIEAAKQAGVISVGVGWGFQTQAALKDAAPDHLYSHPSELIALASETA